MEDIDKIRRHYEIEKELATRLKNSTKEERIVLYTTLYDELFRRVPWHSSLIEKADQENKKIKLSMQLDMLSGFINKNSVFVEIGAGDCSLSLELAKKVKMVNAVDVSLTLTKAEEELPDNFKLTISHGTAIEVPVSSVDVAYSHHMVEHLHPDDMEDHLKSVNNILRPGGMYIFATPHRFSGPVDISKGFDRVATGFHLKEYIFSELISLLGGCGFSGVNIYCSKRGMTFKVPVLSVKILECFMKGLPYSLRKKLSRLIFRGSWYIVAKKN